MCYGGICYDEWIDLRLKNIPASSKWCFKTAVFTRTGCLTETAIIIGIYIFLIRAWIPRLFWLMLPLWPLWYLCGQAVPQQNHVSHPHFFFQAGFLGFHLSRQRYRHGRRTAWRTTWRFGHQINFLQLTTWPPIQHTNSDDRVYKAKQLS